MNRTRAFVFGLSVAVLCAGATLAEAETPAAWPDIKVETQADRPVTSTQKLSAQKDGFQRLEISLSNKGKEPLTITRITVRIPLAKPPAGDLKMVYGGSCMGRTPLLIQTVGEQSNKSSSHMYEMVRLADGQYLFAGSLSWRIFLPNFTLSNGQFVIWSEGEGRQLQPGETIQYERIALSRAPGWLDLLDRFGSAIAVENNITKMKKAEFKGWATWDYYGGRFTANTVYGNMAELNKIAPNANLVQIDGGWWTERGDYTSVRPDITGGIKAIASRISAEGKIAGLHFDGFRGDANSEVCKKHPEYFLHDQDGKLIVEVQPKLDVKMNYTYFDYSHPGARAYIAECIRTMKGWGVQYFKVDFMRFGLEQDIKKSVKTVKTIKAYDPKLSGVERFRLGMQTIREAIGPDRYFLGCSAVFGPTIGFVDAMRTGGDISPRYQAFPERCLANLGNYYLTGKVFNGDADYLVFRSAEDEDQTVTPAKVKHGTLTLNEAQMWADFVKLYGNFRLESDNLMTLRPERKALFREVLDAPMMDEAIPLDLWRHGKDRQDGFELILAHKGKQVFLGVFNWGDQPKKFDLGQFQKGSVLTLDGRHSKILPYAGKLSFAELSETMAASQR